MAAFAWSALTMATQLATRHVVAMAIFEVKSELLPLITRRKMNGKRKRNSLCWRSHKQHWLQAVWTRKSSRCLSCCQAVNSVSDQYCVGSTVIWEIFVTDFFLVCKIFVLKYYCVLWASQGKLNGCFNFWGSPPPPREYFNSKQFPITLVLLYVGIFYCGLRIFQR